MAVQLLCGPGGNGLWAARDGAVQRNSTVACNACDNYDVVATIDVDAQTYTATVNGVPITTWDSPYDFRPNDDTTVDDQLTHYFLWKKGDTGTIDLAQTGATPVWVTSGGGGGGSGGAGGTGGAPGTCDSYTPTYVSASGFPITVQDAGSAETNVDVEVFLRPSQAGTDVVWGVSDASPVEDYADFLASFRFYTNNLIEARYSGTYGCPDAPGATCPGYTPGVWYKAIMSINTGTDTFSLSVGECDGAQTTLLTDRPLRDGTDAAFVRYHAAVEQVGTADVTGFSWGPAPCESLICLDISPFPALCGTYSDGCSGTLDCDTPNGGTCDARSAGDVCLNGTCCTPQSDAAACTAADAECGPVVNNCGQTVASCGTCGGGTPDCQGGTCVASAGRGPTGQWPPGFPAYSTAATTVTGGDEFSLETAINACGNSDCVIEVTSNIGGGPMLLDRSSGTGHVVIRPAIGNRAGLDLTGVKIRGDNILIAGFRQTGGNMYVAGGGSNSGYAWIDNPGGGGNIGCEGYSGTNSLCLFYEIVIREYAVGAEDRFYGRYGGGGSSDTIIVGSWLTGGTLLPPRHSDTLQCASDGSSGSCSIEVYDTVLWPSGDKCVQGESGIPQFTFDNVWMASPNLARQMWTGTTDISGFYQSSALTGGINTGESISNSSLYGECVNYPCPLQNTIYYNQPGGLDNPSDWIDNGGNTGTATLTPPADPPTPAELDSIWSP